MPTASPGFSSAPGTYTGVQADYDLRLRPRAQVYHMTDGAMPTCASTLYRGIGADFADDYVLGARDRKRLWHEQRRPWDLHDHSGPEWRCKLWFVWPGAEPSGRLGALVLRYSGLCRR